MRRKLVGTLALALVVVWVLLMYLLIALNWNDLTGGYYGWNLGFDGRTIIYVTPRSAVEQAGVRAGDQIDWKTLPLLGRSNLAVNEAAPLNAQLRATVVRGNTARIVALLPTRWPRALNDVAHAIVFAQLVLIGIGVALVWLRPSRMTWGFLLASLSGPNVLKAENDPAVFLLLNGSVAVLNGFAAAGLLMFVSRFPKDEPAGVLRTLDRVAIPYGVLVCVLYLALDFTTMFSTVPPPSWLLVALRDVIPPLTTTIVLAALVASYTMASGSDRQRILPVLAAVAFLVVAGGAGAIYNGYYTAGIVSTILPAATMIGQILLAIAVAHGIIRHRVFDLSFAISRTVVYTLLTTILVGAFALVDFASSKLFERLGVTLVLEAVVALAFGFWINALHNRIDHFIDRVLFRRRHLAEERLNRTARTLLHAESVGFIDEALAIEASDALDLASATVFRRDGDGFVRAIAEGWTNGHATMIHSDDHLVVNLRAELQPIDLLSVRWPRSDVPNEVRHPILAVPLVVRHELLGFVLYGGHKGGEAIDPDEKKLLAHLAHNAASAYEHIRAKTLLAESSALRAEVALLKEKQALLREIVEALKR